MVVVSAFGTLAGTTNAGMVAYYRAPNCDEVTIADVLPILLKINYYEDEYVIGEMLIWDTGTQSFSPNNCAMVRVIVYNDGWICAWFDKESVSQGTTGGCTFVNSYTLGGFGAFIEYPDEWNACQLVVESSSPTDPECPDGSVFTIVNTDNAAKTIEVEPPYNTTTYHFNTGYSYTVRIEMTNGSMLWYSNRSYMNTVPPTNSNRLYRAIYEVWEKIKYSSNTSNYTNTNASLIYMYDHTFDTYTDETTDFNDIGVDDCQVFPSNEVIDDCFYIGYTYKFSGINITMGTVGIGSGVTWEYWDGSVWTALSCVDGTVGFTATGDVTFNPPDDWNKTYVNSRSYFWVRARITTASYTTTPLLTQGQLRVSDSLGYLDNEFGLYNFEFTSANYCMLCGMVGYKSSIHGAMTDYYYTTVLPGKTIYSNTGCCGIYYRCAWSYAGIREIWYSVNDVRYFYKYLYKSSSQYSKVTRKFKITSVPAIQDVHEFYIYGYTTGSPYPSCYWNIGTVLITS